MRSESGKFGNSKIVEIALILTHFCCLTLNLIENTKVTKLQILVIVDWSNKSYPSGLAIENPPFYLIFKEPLSANEFSVLGFKVNWRFKGDCWEGMWGWVLFAGFRVRWRFSAPGPVREGSYIMLLYVDVCWCMLCGWLLNKRSVKT
jgi:hypothetical protein